MSKEKTEEEIEEFVESIYEMESIIRFERDWGPVIYPKPIYRLADLWWIMCYIMDTCLNNCFYDNNYNNCPIYASSILVNIFDDLGLVTIFPSEVFYSSGMCKKDEVNLEGHIKDLKVIYSFASSMLNFVSLLDLP